MAGNNIRVSTDKVAQIASELENLNKQLSSELQQSKQSVDHLRNVWQGEAADTTIQNFDSFAAKYFNQYEDVINQYVKFLRNNVESGYTIIENQNVRLGQQFK